MCMQKHKSFTKPWRRRLAERLSVALCLTMRTQDDARRFCRYADDCNIYVKSQKAGERVMKGITRFALCALEPLFI